MLKCFFLIIMVYNVYKTSYYTIFSDSGCFKICFFIFFSWSKFCWFTLVFNLSKFRWIKKLISIKEPKTIDTASQASVECRNAKTETSCGLVGSGLDVSISRKGLPILVESIKNAFIDGGYDPRAWDQMTLDSTPVANFADVLYIQVSCEKSRHFLKYWIPW